MNSEGHQTILNPASSEGSKTTAPVAETRNGKDPDRTTEVRKHRSCRPQVDVTRNKMSLSCDSEYASRRTTKARSLTPDQEPRQFLTGIEYRTKFMRETRNGKDPDRTTKARIHRSRLAQEDVTRREKSACCATEHAPRRITKARSLTPGDENPRQFLTGVEYRTKFMRKLPSDAGQDCRFNSGASKSQQTRADTRTVNQWRPNRENTYLTKQPIRTVDANKSTSEVGRNHSQNFANRKPPQFNKFSAEVRMPHAISHSGKTKPPNDAKDNQKTIKAGIPMCHKTSRPKTATPSIDTTKTKGSPIRREEITARLQTNDSSRFRLDLEQIYDSTHLDTSDNFLNGINKFDLSINLPNSPTPEPTGTNSRHTTPRSPRLVQKNFSNSLFYSAISETLSLQPGNSILYSEKLEMRRTGSPITAVNCSQKLHGPSNKYKFLPSSDISFTTKTRESVANAPRAKTKTSKQEPETFTNQFVPLLRWTDKTHSGGLFEPHANSRPDSSANQDGCSGSNDKPEEDELFIQSLKVTGSIDGVAVQNECYLNQQIAAIQDCDMLNSGVTDVSGEGEKITSVTTSNKKSTTRDDTPSNDANRNHTRNQVPSGRKVWNLTGPQQIVSGCALCPASTAASQLPQRPQSMKHIMMTKQPAAYTRNASRPFADFARRPISARITGKMKEATGNKKPVWK